MANTRSQIDLAVGESDANGGDIQYQTTDFATVAGYENQTYLALFGGNVKQSTSTVQPNTQRFDFWANSLFFNKQPNKQFNSETERLLNVVKLNSAGRTQVEAAVKTDLKYLTSLGATVKVQVLITGVNMLQINIDTIYQDGKKRLTIIKFGRSNTNGDFSVLDFNEDFY